MRCILTLNTCLIIFFIKDKVFTAFKIALIFFKQLKDIF